MGRAGFLPVWRAYTTKEKAILLELIWMSLFRAERFVQPDVCEACLSVAASLPRPISPQAHAAPVGSGLYCSNPL